MTTQTRTITSSERMQAIGLLTVAQNLTASPAQDHHRGLRRVLFENLNTTLCGRVYLGPEPERGPHPGYRGPIRVDLLGVHVDEDCEWLFIKDSPAEWPDSEWEPVLKPTLVPWHRVDQIEWDTSGEH